MAKRSIVNRIELVDFCSICRKEKAITFLYGYEFLPAKEAIMLCKECEKYFIIGDKDQ